MTKEQVVVVGAGHGGVQAITTLRQEGYAGRISLIDTDRDLPYHKPPLSKGFLKAPEAPVLALRSDNFYRDNSVELMLGETVKAIDRQHRTVTLKGGAILGFEHLVLATGSTPILPQLSNVGLEGVVALRTLANARQLETLLSQARAIVIVGAGFIGLELAHTIAGLGYSVTVIEAASRILARSSPPEIADHVNRRSTGFGIGICLNTRLASFQGLNNKVTHIVTSAGETLPADMVVLGIGALPSVELAASAGLRLDNGVAVDAQMRTDDPAIFAIGDMASFPNWMTGTRLRLESVQNATDQAKTAAKAILGKARDYKEVPWFWSDQGDMKLQTAGIAAAVDRRIVLGEQESNSLAVYQFSGHRLMAVDTINRPADHMIARKLLAIGLNPTVQDVEAGPKRLKELVDSVR